MNPPITPPSIQSAFDTIWGSKAPTGASPNTSRANEIRTLAKQSAPVEQEPSFGSRVASDVQNAGQNVEEAISGTGQFQGDNPITRGFEATSEAASGVAKTASELLPSSIRTSVSKIGNAAGGAIQGAGDAIAWLGDKIGNTKLAQDIVSAHPKITDMILNSGEQLAKIGSSSGNISTNILGAEGVSKFGEGAAKVGEKVVNGGFNMVDKIKGSPEAFDTKQASSDLQAIKETISPKMTVKEAKLAETQGRLVKGKEPTLLKSGTPDQIITSDQQLKSVTTIKRLIPDAAKMDEPTLYSALDSKIAETAENLKPEMEKTPINQQTVKNITDKWDSLKKTQMETADASEEANVLKQQKQFEARLQKSENGSMNDLWNTAKEYDASVPDNVKKANDLSSESLQNKKSLWLQNRAILRDAINDSSNGLGKTSQQAFSDMRDMYEAQNGILSKAKVETKVQPSKLRQAYDSKTGKVIRTVAKYGVGGEILKKGLGL